MPTAQEIDIAALTQAVRDSRVACAPTVDALALQNSTTFEIIDERETSRGICWTARLQIGDGVLEVENRGDGASNRYAVAAGSTATVDEVTARVAVAIPELGLDTPLDAYCTLAEVYLDYRAQLLARTGHRA
jgi:hypothetical protein